MVIVRVISTAMTGMLMSLVKPFMSCHVFVFLQITDQKPICSFNYSVCFYAVIIFVHSILMSSALGRCFCGICFFTGYPCNSHASLMHPQALLKKL